MQKHLFSEMNANIRKFGIIPVVVINDADNAVPVTEALLRAGLNCVEITFRTPAARESIKRISERFGDSVLVGAGTVLTRDNVDQAVSAGARFIDSPVMDTEIIEQCIAYDVPIYPGCATASEIMQCVKRGITMVKFFPAEDLGGPLAIKSIAAALRGVEFIPAGGIDREKMRKYLELDMVAAVGGSWMCKSGFIKNKEFGKIEKLTREAIYFAKLIRK